MDSVQTVWGPRALSLLRIVAGLLFLEHGIVKVFAFPAGPGFSHLPPLFMAAGLIEVVGGALMVLGLFTRIAAFVMSGEMAVAYFMVFLPHSFFPLVNHGEAAILYCFIFLYFAAAGSGAWSLDAMRRAGGAAPGGGAG
ncbi:MAG: DoxX family protein [Rhodospirillales bacterium]|nr:DoxX family protein [Rhodospirillales bacterium]